MTLGCEKPRSTEHNPAQLPRNSCHRAGQRHQWPGAQNQVTAAELKPDNQQLKWNWHILRHFLQNSFSEKLCGSHCSTWNPLTGLCPCHTPLASPTAPKAWSFPRPGSQLWINTFSFKYSNFLCCRGTSLFRLCIMFPSCSRQLYTAVSRRILSTHHLTLLPSLRFSVRCLQKGFMSTERKCWLPFPRQQSPRPSSGLQRSAWLSQGSLSLFVPGFCGRFRLCSVYHPAQWTDPTDSLSGNRVLRNYFWITGGET